LAGVKSLGAFKTALLATGVGALVVGLGLLISNFDKLKSALGFTANEQNKLNNETEIYNQLIAQTDDFVKNRTRSLNNELRLLKEQGKTIEEINDAELKGRQDILNKLEEKQKSLRERVFQLQTEKGSIVEINKVNGELLKSYDEVANATTELRLIEQRIENQREKTILNNERRRTELIGNELQKRLAQLRLTYQEERKEAIKNGEDLVLVDKIYAKQRAEIIKQAADEINKVVLSSTIGSFNLELANIQKRVDELLQNVNISEIAKNLSLSPEETKEVITSWGEQQKAILKTTTAAQGYATQLDALLKAQEQGVEFIKRQSELIKTEIEIDGEIITTLSSSQAITSLDTQILETRLKAFDEELEAFKLKELSKIKELLTTNGATKEAIDEELKSYEELYTKLNENRKQAFKINLQIQTAETASIEKSIDLERKLNEEKLQILNNELLSEEVKTKTIKELDDKLKKDLLENEINFRKQKLELLKTDPTSSPEAIAKLNNDILELEIKLKEGIIATEKEKTNAAKEAAEIRKQILRSFSQEAAFQTDAVLSGITSILSTAQSENRKLLQEGKISAEENERRQRKLFEEQKQIEIARTVISTISSAQGAYQSQFVPVPDPSSPVRGAIFAAAALAAGYARVRAIQNQTYGGSAASAPQPVNTASFLRDPGTSQVIEPQRDPNIPPSIRVFVTENDITETQRRVRVIQNGSRTTF
jgi:hypothetical protein